MASMMALERALNTLIDNGHRVPQGTTLPRIGEHWSKYLDPVSDEDLQEAIDRLVLTRYATVWPTIGAVLANVPRVKNNRLLEDLDDADEVFGEVLELVRSRGYYAEPGPLAFDADPARSQAIFAGVRAAGGWRGLCLGTERELASQRAAFRAAFKSNRTKSQIHGNWKPERALQNLGANGEPVSIGGILEHMEIGA